MSNKSPIFPLPDPQHFNDYGFDPQFNYFQVLEEARKLKRGASSRSIDSSHFKLQKPISKEESNSKKPIKNKRWWKNALFFFKWKWIHITHLHDDDDDDDDDDMLHGGARGFRASISGPVYIIESRSGSSTPYRTTSKPSSGPLAGTLSPVNKGDFPVPYLSLRELNMEQQQQRNSTSSMPIYLVKPYLRCSSTICFLSTNQIWV